jgi:hypothetical protein
VTQRLVNQSVLAVADREVMGYAMIPQRISSLNSDLWCHKKTEDYKNSKPKRKGTLRGLVDGGGQYSEIDLKS